MIPAAENVKNNLLDLASEVDSMGKNINGQLNNITTQLADIHIGVAIIDFLVTGFVCFLIGIFSTLFVCQKYSGKIQERAYKMELQLAEEKSVTDYKNSLVSNNSGIVEIKSLEKQYILNHKDNYKNPNEYIEQINQKIIELKNNQSFSDNTNKTKKRSKLLRKS